MYPLQIEHSPSETRNRSHYAFYIAFVASLGGFLFGYDLVIIAGAQIFLRDQFKLSPQQFGFATSSALLGCIAGPFLGAWISDRLGRKAALYIAAALFAIGAVGTALARDIPTFNVFRILGGVGVGLASLASPMYIAEVAPPKNRGSLGLMYQQALTIGTVMATFVSFLLAKSLAPETSWRWMFASVLVPVAIFSVMLIPLPASPRWLAERGKLDDALAILSRFGSPEEARKELAEIEASVHEELGSIREFLRPGMRTALITGIMLAIFSNWTGWTAISFYVPTLLQHAGFAKPSDAIAQTVWVNVGSACLTLVAVFLVDRLGRRPLWIGASAVMSFCLILTGALFQIRATGEIVVFAVFLCVVPYAIGIGPITWLMMSEFYPTDIRAKAVSISTTILWVAGFTAPFVFPLMEVESEHVLHTVGGVFWAYSIVCMVSLIWGWKCLPETRGRSLEEIASSWKRPAGVTKSKAR